MGRISFKVLGVVLGLALIASYANSENEKWTKVVHEGGNDIVSVIAHGDFAYIQSSVQGQFMPANFLVSDEKTLPIKYNGKYPNSTTSMPAVVLNKMLFFVSIEGDQDKNELVAIEGAKATKITGVDIQSAFAPVVIGAGGECPFFIVETAVFKLSGTKATRIWTADSGMPKDLSTNGDDMLFSCDHKLWLASGKKVSQVVSSDGKDLPEIQKPKLAGDYFAVGDSSRSLYQLSGTKAKLIGLPQHTMARRLVCVGGVVLVHLDHPNSRTLDQNIFELKGAKLKACKAVKGMKIVGSMAQSDSFALSVQRDLAILTSVQSGKLTNVLIDGKKAVKLAKPSEYDDMQVIDAVKGKKGYFCLLGRIGALAQMVILSVDSVGNCTIEKNAEGEPFTAPSMSIASANGIVFVNGRGTNESESNFALIHK
ncbi:hypothetical protein OAU50_00745 [Planctomycetota bacterium]|nr:hypothetical protein [Planctomycetota bacterium]